MVSAASEDLSAALRYDDHIASLVEVGRQEIAELWGEVGSLGGYAEAGFGSVGAPVETEVLRTAYWQEMATIPPSDLPAIEQWLSTQLGRKIAFLTGQLDSPQGRRELQRGGRAAAAHVDTVRQGLLTRIEAETRVADLEAHRAQTWLGLINDAADQIGKLPDDDDDDWREDLVDLDQGWTNQLAQGRWTRLAFLYARLSDEELESFLSFASSQPGRSLFDARHDAAVAVVDHLAVAIRDEQRRLLAEAWREQADVREEEDDQEEDGEP